MAELNWKDKTLKFLGFNITKATQRALDREEGAVRAAFLAKVAAEKATADRKAAEIAKFDAEVKAAKAETAKNLAAIKAQKEAAAKAPAKKPVAKVTEKKIAIAI